MFHQNECIKIENSIYEKSNFLKFDLIYFTLRNLGGLIKIILKLKNNINNVSTGNINRIKSEPIRDGIPANNKCIK